MGLPLLEKAGEWDVKGHLQGVVLIVICFKFGN